MAASTCAMGADLVAEWGNFSNLTSTVGNYSLTTSCSVSDGVLSVTHSTNAAAATIDLTSAGLTMDSGITVSLTLSNLDIVGSNDNNPAAIFGLATTGKDNAFIAGFDDNSTLNSSQYALAYDGSGSKVSPNRMTATPAPTGDTPVTITLTIADTAVNYYLNGNSIGSATLNISGNDWTAETITTLSLGSWPGSSANSRSSAKFYNLAVYSGAMSASEVAALVPEPTTATLSLLALAGLAARRRRK